MLCAPVATAHGGGGGGFSGDDSSMNPFTGDSSAYFHGGPNLGEEGMIRPGRPAPHPQWRAKASRPDTTANKPAPGSDAAASTSRDDTRARAPTQTP